MKSISIIVLIMSCLSISQPSWHISVVDSTGEVGTYCTLSLDENNTPHIAYLRVYTSNDDLRYSYYNGSTWVVSVVTNSVDILEPCIDVDNNNNPCISYGDYDDLKYSVYSGGSWQTSIITQYGRGTALKVDSLNHPHIAFYDYNVYHLKYAYSDGTDWLVQEIDAQYASGQGINNSITVDSQDNPHISYCQDAIGQLRYAHLVSGSWVIEYPDSLTGPVGNSTSIALDNLDRPSISHCSELRYCTKTSGTWQTQVVDDTGLISFTSLALDQNYYPHVAYKNTSLDQLMMAHWNGSSWQTETVDPTPNAGFYCSLELDSEDRPHIAYMIGGNTDDLMYAWYGEGNIGVTIPSFTTQPAQNSIKLCWQAENSGPAALAGFNLYRIDLSRDPDKKYVKLNNNLITGNSPYSFLDAKIESGINYQYRLWATYTDGSREEVGSVECSNNSIQPAAFSLISVYPNPAKSTLTCCLSLTQPSEINLSLYDISGRLVLAKRYAVPTGEQDINIGLGKMAKGVYTVQVETGGVVESKRIVVMR
jgi:hypothetical protein